MTAQVGAKMRSLAAVLLAAWAGSLWTICGLVAPMLFATLDRQLAGQMAGQFFHVATWLGVSFAVILLGLPPVRRALLQDRKALWLVAFTVGAPLISELIVGPMMRSARAAGDMAQFGLLHGVSATLFFAACLSAIVLVWRVVGWAESSKPNS